MTIDDAIKILQPVYHDFMPGPSPQAIKAVRLGVEALKLNKLMREHYPHPELLKLPGETEE